MAPRTEEDRRRFEEHQRDPPDVGRIFELKGEALRAALAEYVERHTIKACDRCGGFRQAGDVH